MIEIKQGQIWQNKLVPEEYVQICSTLGGKIYYKNIDNGKSYESSKLGFMLLHKPAEAYQINTKPAVIDGVTYPPSWAAGQKHDQTKPRFSLIPHQALWQVVAVLEFGAKKYGAENWRGVENARERYFNACHRHLNAWWQGESVDDESGLPHLAHAVCCLIFLMSLGESND